MAFSRNGVDVPTTTTKKTAKPVTYDHLKSLKAPRRKTIEIYGSDDAVELVDDLETRLEDATDPARVSELQAELEAAREALEASTVRVTLQSIGRKRYEDLVASHPATKQQDAESKEATGQPAPYNTETFPAALIAASAVEPELTVEQANEIWDDWNSGELMDLFFGAIEVNTQRRSGLGKGFGGLND